MCPWNFDGALISAEDCVESAGRDPASQDQRSSSMRIATIDGFKTVRTFVPNGVKVIACSFPQGRIFALR